MVNDALWVLLITTFIVAATHTLSPDHWFGFVMLGRTRKWGIPKTLTVAGICRCRARGHLSYPQSHCNRSGSRPGP